MDAQWRFPFLMKAGYCPVKSSPNFIYASTIASGGIAFSGGGGSAWLRIKHPGGIEVEVGGEVGAAYLRQLLHNFSGYGKTAYH
jgi:hypothetical protein